MNKYFIIYGNYINNYTDVIDAEDENDATEYAYNSAIQVCEDTEGFQGFGSREEFRECNPDATEEEINDDWNQHIENYAEYSICLYDPKKHDDYL